MLPQKVARALARAAELNFEMSCEPEVGRLLTTLAASVPDGGRVLEIGTGAGVGTSWLVEGMASRKDVSLITIDIDDALVDAVEADGWPAWVTFIRGDAVAALEGLGHFALIFADAPAGKWIGLDRTVAALQTGGFLVVDDMQPDVWVDDNHRDNTLRVREELMSDEGLVTCELNASSGVILAVRRQHD